MKIPPSAFPSLLFAPFLGLASPATAEVTLFGPETSLQFHMAAQLGPVQQKGFRDFVLDLQYFGVFVIVPDTDVYVFMRGFHSLSRATSYALSYCEFSAASQNVSQPDCMIFASAIPASLGAEALMGKGAEALPEGLGHPSYSTFIGAYQSDQVDGTYGAFAISNFAQDGYSVGFSSSEAASAQAIAECETWVAREIAPYPKQIRDQIRKYGLDRCWVVDVHRP